MLKAWIYSGAVSAALCLSLALCPAMASAGVKKQPEKGSLGVIIEKDLFRPSRQKPSPPKPKPKPKAEPVAVLPPPKSPPPRLTLSGTVLLDSGDVALLSLQGEGASGRYRIGDEIAGFRITEIGSDRVTLRRDDELLSVFMNSGQAGVHAPQALHGAPGQSATGQSAPLADIPPALVPRPQSPFTSAPYRWNSR